MKKVILGAAALLFSGALMAQNNSTSNQSGDDQRVFVRQAGTNLTSDVTQGNGSGLGSNKAKIWQQGDGSMSTVSQLGENNQALVEQVTVGGAAFGNNQTSTITQGGLDDSSKDNKAKVRQHDGDGNTATINQDGLANEAYAHQDGNTNTVTTNQNGTTAKSYIRQIGDSNTGNITQGGTNNQSYARQYGDGNTVNVDQAGADNKADQKQNSTGAASGNTGTINQAGTGDMARQRQVGGGNTALAEQGVFYAGSSSGGYIEQNQTGNGNTANLEQDGTDHYARQDQEGNDNYANGDQFNFNANNKLYQRQIGSDNFVSSGQYSGDNNLTSTYQDDLNTGYTTQTGGGDNQILLVQKSQGGAGHLANVSQNGVGNMADVLQLGPGGDFSSDGVNCDFQDPEILLCPTPLDEITIDAPCAEPSQPGC